MKSTPFSPLCLRSAVSLLTLPVRQSVFPEFLLGFLVLVFMFFRRKYSTYAVVLVSLLRDGAAFIWFSRLVRFKFRGAVSVEGLRHPVRVSMFVGFLFVVCL